MTLIITFNEMNLFIF